MNQKVKKKIVITRDSKKIQLFQPKIPFTSKINLVSDRRTQDKMQVQINKYRNLNIKTNFNKKKSATIIDIYQNTKATPPSRISSSKSDFLKTFSRKQSFVNCFPLESSNHIENHSNTNKLQHDQNQAQFPRLQILKNIQRLHILDLKVRNSTQQVDELISKSRRFRDNQKKFKKSCQKLSYLKKDQYQHKILTLQNGYTYNGETYNNIPTGKGIINHHKSILFQGSWLKGLYHGEGKLYNLNFNQLTQQKALQKLQNQIKQQSINLNEWKYYKGNFYDGYRHGRGVLVLPGDYEIHGEFYQDCLLGNFDLINKYNSKIGSYSLKDPINF